MVDRIVLYLTVLKVCGAWRLEGADCQSQLRSNLELFRKVQLFFAHVIERESRKEISIITEMKNVQRAAAANEPMTSLKRVW